MRLSRLSQLVDWRPLRHCAAAVICACLAAGCSTQGDFGAVKPGLVRDDIHDWMSQTATGSIPSTFELTDDERLLRDLGYPLIEPPYDRQHWDSVLNEYGHSAGLYRIGMSRDAYAANLLSTRYRSAAARYAQLIDDVRNDLDRMPAFFETAARVLDLDRKREKSLSLVSHTNPGERANALRRIRENAAVARWVHTSLTQRHAAYRYALERLVVMTPSPQAADADIALRQLQEQISRYRIGPLPVSKGGDSYAQAR